MDDFLWFYHCTSDEVHLSTRECSHRVYSLRILQHRNLNFQMVQQKSRSHCCSCSKVPSVIATTPLNEFPVLTKVELFRIDWANIYEVLIHFKTYTYGSWIQFSVRTHSLLHILLSLGTAFMTVPFVCTASVIEITLLFVCICIEGKAYSVMFFIVSRC